MTQDKWTTMRIKAAVELLKLKWGRVAPIAKTWAKSASSIAGHLCLAFVTDAGEVRQEWV